MRGRLLTLGVPLLLGATIAPAQIPQAERDALVALYNATGGDSWTSNEGWLGSPGTECTWYGVTCGETGLAVEPDNSKTHGAMPPQTRRVEALSLDTNNLAGTIPSSIRNLTELAFLNLGYNALVGSIPPEIGRLRRLQSLYLDHNQLTGTIAPQLGGLTELVSLLLYHNDLTGAIPAELGSLRNLEQLAVGNNELHGSIPGSLGNLSELRSLTFTNNNLSGTVPPEIGSLTHLETLFFTNNNLTDPIAPQLANLTNLKRLALSGNLFSAIPEWIGTLRNLESLGFSDGQVSGEIPSGIRNLSNLEALELHSNELTGEIPAWLGELTQLDYLSLYDNRLSGPLPTELGNLQQLRALLVSRNQLVGEIPGSLMNMTGLDLEFGLFLRYNGLSTEDAALREWINDRQYLSDFESTQTVPPADVTATPQGTGSIHLTWTPIRFDHLRGGYRASYSTSPSGPFTMFDQTADKTVSWMDVDGLSPQQTYYFRVQSVTYPHGFNQNTVVSEPSAVVSATTAPAGVVGSVQLAFSAFSASEGERKDVTVRRLGGADGEVSVQYATTAGTADEGSDYIPNSGTVTWSDGDGAPKTIPVFVVDDAQPEGDETVTVTIGSPTGGATLGSPTTAVLTIADSDFWPDEEGDTNSAGRNADVATDPYGNRVVVWSEEGGDDDGKGVMAQRYDPTGATIGSRIQVNVTTAGDQHSPAVATSNSGRFIVVWEHDVEADRKTRQAGNGIFGRFFDGNGAPVTGEIVVDDGSFGEPSEPAVAVEPLSGRVVVVWTRESVGKNATDGAGVFGRYFDPTGQPAGDVITVDEDAVGEPGSPDVAVSDDGYVVVAWELVGTDGWSDVYARKLDGTGKALGPQTQVNEDTWRSQESPAVVVSADGGFLVVWQGPSLPDDQGSREIGADIFGRYFNPGGDAQAEPFLINDTLFDSQTTPAVTANTNGDCWAAWSQERRSGGSGIFGRFLPGCAEPRPANHSIQLNDPSGDPTLRSPSVAVDDDGAVTVVYTKDDVVEGDGSVVGRAVGQPPPGECLPDQTAICLTESRFEVMVDWRDFAGNTGDGQAVPLTSDTGYFWFFDSSNVELVIKVLDGTAINGFYWVFYGALSNVEYTITVTDTETGNRVSYFNPLGTFASRGITDALPGDNRILAPAQRAATRQSTLPTGREAQVLEELSRPGMTTPWMAAAQACTPGAEQLCLNDERFSVRVSWRDFDGNSGSGQAAPLTSDTGYFWFFNEANVELIIKVLDGRAFNQHYWVFYGALSDVEYTITVTDTETGAVRSYTNPLGGFLSAGDTEAFFVP